MNPRRAAGPLRPLEDWFARQGWTPFRFQREAWSAYLGGESGLIHAPTGMGKSYAAWCGALVEWLAEPGSASSSAEAPPLRVLWITPLRALAADLAESLRRPLADLAPSWTLERRTGDTSAAVKRRQRTRLPTALITTPESLSLLLSYPGSSAAFETLRCVVIDEWHELMSTKRGVQTELGLARLRRLAPDVRVWGLSATLGNLEQARDVLMGSGGAGRGRIVHDRTPKRVEIDTLIPRDIERFPWSGHLGTRLTADVVEALRAAHSTLLFTNTRSQAEAWYRSLHAAAPDLQPDLALHHGSLDRHLREEVETRLREGRLRCVVCTSSLDLGVDYSPVDQVIQLGSPKGIGRLIQRAGRSGHRPGGVSRILGVPTHAFELVEFAAARDVLRSKQVEPRPALERPLDLLAQHVVTMALGAGPSADDLYDEVRGAWAYRDLDRDTWQWVLDFVRRGGESLRAYPRFQRVVERQGRLAPASEEIARTHRMTIGTIASDTAMEVRFGNGRRLGTIEEMFVARIKPGQAFHFAGRLVELVHVRETVAVVRPAKRTRGTVPQWQGGKSPLSSRLAAAVRVRLDAARQGRFEGDEMQAVKPVLLAQQAAGGIPAPDELLVELAEDDGLHLLYLFPFEGRLVHEGLAALIAHRAARRRPDSITATVTDYGIELRTERPWDVDEATLRAWLSVERIVDDLLDCLNTGELTRRQFREVARVAGLVFEGYPGRRRTSRQLQASSGLLYEVFERYDPRNLLLAQARREVLERQLEVSRLTAALTRQQAMRIRLVRTERLSPLAFPLWAESLRAQHVTSESWLDRVRKMSLRLERETGGRARRAR